MHVIAIHFLKTWGLPNWFLYYRCIKARSWVFLRGCRITVVTLDVTNTHVPVITNLFRNWLWEMISFNNCGQQVSVPQLNQKRILSQNLPAMCSWLMALIYFINARLLENQIKCPYSSGLYQQYQTMKDHSNLW